MVMLTDFRATEADWEWAFRFVSCSMDWIEWNGDSPTFVDLVRPSNSRGSLDVSFDLQRNLSEPLSTFCGVLRPSTSPYSRDLRNSTRSFFQKSRWLISQLPSIACHGDSSRRSAWGCCECHHYLYWKLRTNHLKIYKRDTKFYILRTRPEVGLNENCILFQ
jgi:hypothetical protein